LHGAHCARRAHCSRSTRTGPRSPRAAARRPVEAGHRECYLVVASDCASPISRWATVATAINSWHCAHRRSDVQRNGASTRPAAVDADLREPAHLAEIVRRRALRASPPARRACV
jgi:hypothetical protein